MEHIAAEKGSVTEMVQKVSLQCYLEEFDLVLNCQILMTGGFWKFIGDGCCLGQISRY